MLPNPYRYHAPPGWSDMTSAPTDGTVIEIQNNYGIAPCFGLYKRQDEKWIDVVASHQNSTMYISEGDIIAFSCRPYTGTVEDYVDPTFGEQDKPEYWRNAVKLPFPTVEEVAIPVKVVTENGEKKKTLVASPSLYARLKKMARLA